MNFWVFNILSEMSAKNFADISTWTFLIQIFIIIIAIILGNIIRRKIPFIRRSLIPTAIIAGALILIFKAFIEFGLKSWIPVESYNSFITSGFYIDSNLMEDITYHSLGIGFIALALKTNKKNTTSSTMTVVETGVVTVGGYLVQAIIGLICSIAIFFVIQNLIQDSSNPFMWYSGLLLPLGYGQGTGQALNWGVTYEGLAENSFKGGASFGLACATIGFVVASIGGVIYLNVLRKKGLISKEIIEHHDNNTLEDYQTNNDIPNTESIDKFTIQAALVLGVYAITFGLLYAIQAGLIDTNLLGNFGKNTVSPLLWGFNFLIGTVIAVLAKTIIKSLKKTKLMNREYANNYLLDRIGGFFFDVMIVAGTAAIDFNAMKTLYGPLIIICVCGAIGTFFFVKLTTKEIYKDYPHEGFLAMFGMLTGTASNGMILLREIDPKYETPMANNLVFQTMPAIILGFPFLLLLGFAANSFLNTIITLVVLIIYFIVLLLFIFRKRIFKKKAKN